MTNPFGSIPAKYRAALYLAYALGSVVVVYLAAKEIVGVAEVSLWSGIGAVFGFTAASNTDVSE